MASEIIEEEQEEEEGIFIIKTEAQKDKIRQIIEYQKSLYFASASSSSYSSPLASSSSFASSRASNSLLDLMKEGNTSLRRLFRMEHTSVATHMKEYSGSPVIKPILLWGSDSDDGVNHDPWMGIKRTEPSKAYPSPMGAASWMENLPTKIGNRKCASCPEQRLLGDCQDLRNGDVEVSG